MAEQKSYTGTLQLGVETDTLDSTGTVTRTAPVPDCPPTLLKKIEQRFSGDYWQTPPMYSALKRKGVPLYKLARQGIEVEREPRRVHLSHLALTLGELHAIHFSVSCSKGTYIRVLAADVGLALNSVAHLTRLRRTAFGTFTIDQAIPLSRAQSLPAGTAPPSALIRPGNPVLPDLSGLSPRGGAHSARTAGCFTDAARSPGRRGDGSDSECGV